MARRKSAILLGLAGLAARVSAACTCAGTDYTHGGTYYIDDNSEKYFEFSSIFEGKWAERRPSSTRATRANNVADRLQDGPD
jgi:hypothetical protein